MASDKYSLAPRPGPAPGPPLPAAPARAEDSSWRRRLGVMAAFGTLLVYAGLSQYSASSSGAHAKDLGAALSIAPVLVIGTLLLWFAAGRMMAVLFTLASSAALYRYWPFVEAHYEWSDLVQQCAMYGLVALFFFLSLFGGRVPVCTQLAEKMHGALTPVEVSYTRRATVAWAIFYFAMTLAILALFFTVSLRVWSLFVNFATFGLMMLAGLLDHAIRHRVLPRHPGGGILTILRRSLMG